MFGHGVKNGFLIIFLGIMDSIKVGLIKLVKISSTEDAAKLQTICEIIQNFYETIKLS